MTNTYHLLTFFTCLACWERHHELKNKVLQNINNKGIAEGKKEVREGGREGERKKGRGRRKGDGGREEKRKKAERKKKSCEQTAVASELRVLSRFPGLS